MFPLSSFDVEFFPEIPAFETFRKERVLTRTPRTTEKVNMQKVIKNAAKVVAKAVTQYTGEKFALGRAQEITARLFGFKDYNGLADWLTPEAARAEMSQGERAHADGAGDCQYENEFIMQAASGRFIHAPAYPEPCSYVRIVDRAGNELAYWVSDEWKESPEEVMGAILGALKGSRGLPLPLLNPLLSDAPLSVVPAPGMDIARINLSKVERVRYNDAWYEVVHLNENWRDVFDENEVSMFWMNNDTPVMELIAEEEGLVYEATIRAGTLRELVWQEKEQQFVTAFGNNTYEFWETTRMTPR
jgi:hypothetical protein